MLGKPTTQALVAQGIEHRFPNAVRAALLSQDLSECQFECSLHLALCPGSLYGKLADATDPNFGAGLPPLARVATLVISTLYLPGTTANSQYQYAQIRTVWAGGGRIQPDQHCPVVASGNR
jgi:hypothetical protein